MSEDGSSDPPPRDLPEDRPSRRKIPEDRPSRRNVRERRPGLSRANKRRLAFYPTLLVFGVSGLFYCTCMPGKSYVGPFAPTQEEERLAKELEADVVALAGTIGARNVELEGTLQRAEKQVTARFTELGYAPQRLGYDIGFERALLDWIRKHRDSWRAARRAQLATQSNPPYPTDVEVNKK